jgi:hypothetical protein
MKAFTVLNTAKIVITYLAIVFALAILFTSCSVVRREGSTSPCNNKQAFSGYGADNQGRHVGIIKRKSF